MSDGSLTPDPWAGLRRHTAARVALGRAGASLPTSELLKFSLDHAIARDAAHSELDLERLTQSLEPIGLPLRRVDTMVHDRTTYLQRPDLGRRLSDGARDELQQLASKTSARPDLVILIADELSGLAAQQHATPLLAALVPMLRKTSIATAPLIITRYARVALQDDVGSVMNAKASLILLGERPGLGTPDSLGAYLIFNPRVGATDANRNCVSNIRPAGLPLSAAADSIHYLITQSLRLQLSGVELKDERVNRMLGGHPL